MRIVHWPPKHTAGVLGRLLATMLACVLLIGCSGGTNSDAVPGPTSSSPQDQGKPAPADSPSDREPSTASTAQPAETTTEPAAGPVDAGRAADTLGGASAPAAASAQDQLEEPTEPPTLKLEEAPTVRAIRQAGGKLSELGRNVWLAVAPGKRLVLVLSHVVLRRGYLEHLLCLTNTKEHEAILAADIDPKILHAALLAAGAEPGHPVRFDPEFQPPSGTKLDIQLEWWDGKRFRQASARQWIVHEETGKPIDLDWVFAGSQLVKNPVTGEPYYLAQGGDVITVVNMAAAVIDVAGRSSDKNVELMFVAKESEIPPVGTPVLIILRPLTADDRTEEPSS